MKTIFLFIGIAGIACFYLPAASVPPHAKEEAKVIHVLVALCDNDHQGIVKVPKTIGNGDDAKSNLYWGSSGGVKDIFCKSPEWKLIKTVQNPRPEVLERAVFHRKSGAVYLIADGYRGREIKRTLEDFFTLLRVAYFPASF